MHHGFRLIVIYAERSRYSKDRKVAGEKDKELSGERKENGVNRLIYSTNSRQLSGGRDSSSNHADL